MKKGLIVFGGWKGHKPDKLATRFKQWIEKEGFEVELADSLDAFNNAFGHHADVFDIPKALKLMQRGFLWAAEGKSIALEHGLNGNAYRSNKKMT